MQGGDVCKGGETYARGGGGRTYARPLYGPYASNVSHATPKVYHT